MRDLLTKLKRSVFGSTTTTAASIETRRSLRLPCQCLVRGRTPGGHTFRAAVTDISRTGLHLEEGPQLEMLDQIILEYTPPTPGFERLVEGKVMWCREMGDEQWASGVHFTTPDVEPTWVGTWLRWVGLDQQTAALQRRQHVRLGTSWEAEVRDRATGRFLFTGKVINLSHGGCRVSSDYPDPGVRSVLVLLGPVANAPTLSLPASLLRTSINIGGAYEHGLQFEKVGGSAQRVLDNSLASLMQGRAAL